MGFSIATFDYQRVRSPYSPSSTPNKSPKTPKQTAERKPDVCDGDLNFGRQHGERVWQDGTCCDGWKGSFWPHMMGVYLPILCVYIYICIIQIYIYLNNLYIYIIYILWNTKSGYKWLQPFTMILMYLNELSIPVDCGKLDSMLSSLECVNPSGMFHLGAPFLAR